MGVKQLHHLIHGCHGLLQGCGLFRCRIPGQSLQDLVRGAGDHGIPAHDVRGSVDTVLFIIRIVLMIPVMESLHILDHGLQPVHIGLRQLQTLRRILCIRKVQHRDLRSSADTDTVLLPACLSGVDHIKLSAPLQVHMVQGLQRKIISSGF